MTRVRISRSDPETRSRLGTVLLNSSKKPTCRPFQVVRRDALDELDDLAGVVRGANLRRLGRDGQGFGRGEDRLIRPNHRHDRGVEDVQATDGGALHLEYDTLEELDLRAVKREGPRDRVAERAGAAAKA